MRLSSDELITFLQSDLMLDFGFDDDYVIQSLLISMQELRRMKLDLPAPPRPADPVEKPTKPFGSFEPPSVEQLIASMQVEAVNGEFVGRPSIPPDGGPVIVPEALLKRQASDWSFLDRDNDDVSSVHESLVATDCPSSRTSLVSSLLDNINSLPNTNEPGIVSFIAADCAFSSRTTLTDRSPSADQMSNSEYDNVPASNCDEFSSVYEQELEQTLESIEQEIQELLGMSANSDKHNEVVSSAVTQDDQLYPQPVTSSLSVTVAQQQNHVVDSYACHSPYTESSPKVDNLLIGSSSTSEQHSSTARHLAIRSPSTAVAGATNSTPIMSRSASQPCQKPDDIVVIPIQHLPSTAPPYRPPVKPKPTNLAAKPLNPAVSSSSSSVLTPIPVLHLRTVPIAQFSSMSAVSAGKIPVPTSSANGC